ncbi:hypothetical protein D3C84_1056340 [compost metagenome]
MAFINDDGIVFDYLIRSVHDQARQNLPMEIVLAKPVARIRAKFKEQPINVPDEFGVVWIAKTQDVGERAVIANVYAP